MMEPASTTRKATRTVLYGVIFCSGVSALIYELLWIRILNLTFGVNSFAVATVVSVFLLGLGLGSFIFGKYAERTIRLLRAYALVELGIGAASVLSFIVVQYTGVFTAPLTAVYNQSGLLGLSTVRAVIAVLILILPTFGIGATMPLVSKYVIRKSETLGSQFSWLYLINTAGAFIGAMLTGFVLVRYLGTTLSFGLAVLINVLVFLVVFIRSKKDDTLMQQQLPVPTSNTDKPQTHILPVLFVSGFIGLGFEMIWIRILTNFGAATTISSTLIIGGFLLGFAAGSGWVARRIDRLVHPIRLLVGMFVVSALLSAVILFGFGYLNNFFAEQFPGYAVLQAEMWIGFGSSLLLAIAIGVLFPLGVRLYSGTAAHMGSKAGRAYLINAIGTVCGSLLTGFLLIPFAGIKWSIITMVLLSGAIASWCVYYLKERKARYSGIVLAGTGFAVVIIFLAGEIFHRLPENMEELFYAEGLTATVTVQRYMGSGGPFNVLNVDSQAVAGTYPTGIVDAKMLAHIPLLLIDNPHRVATVGYGTGGTSYSMLSYGTEVYALEIEPEVVTASQYFTELNHESQTDPRLHIITDDARNYLQYTDNAFDAIVTDVTNLKYKSNPYLYTTDYFRIMRDRLTSRGIAAAWVPLDGISFHDLQILAATFRGIFPHTTVWYYSRQPSGFLLFIGTRDQLSISADALETRFAEEQDDLAEIDLLTPYEVAGMLLLGERDVQSLASNVSPNTDNRPILEFSDMVDYGTRNAMDNLARLIKYQTESLEPYFSFNKAQEQEILHQLYTNRGYIQEYIAGQ